MAERLLKEHAGDEEALIYHVALQLSGALREGDDAKAEDWRQMIGMIEELGRQAQ